MIADSYFSLTSVCFASLTYDEPCYCIHHLANFIVVLLLLVQTSGEAQEETSAQPLDTVVEETDYHPGETSSKVLVSQIHRLVFIFSVKCC